MSNKFGLDLSLHTIKLSYYLALYQCLFQPSLEMAAIYDEKKKD
jgi:hypothetical protein